VALSDSGQYGIIFEFLIDRSIVPAETTATAYALNLRMNNPRLVRYARVLGLPQPLPPPSTEQLGVWFNKPMSDLEVHVFAQANGLVAVDLSSFSGGKVFLFALDRSIVPADTTAAMYAEKLEREYPDLVRSAFADRVVGTVLRQAGNAGTGGPK